MNSDQVFDILAPIFCIAGPLFFTTTVLVSVYFIRYLRRSNEERESDLREKVRIIKSKNSQIRLLEERIHSLRKSCAEKESELREKAQIESSLKYQIRLLEKRIQILSQDARADACREWLLSMANRTYRNEIEVEIKFVYPLFRFLGYSDEDLLIRVPVRMQVGRQQIQAQADWVIFRNGNPVIVVEAKEPGHPLGEQVVEQAKSYAFGLKVPLYAVTNGRRLQVFRREVVNDICLIDCVDNELSNYWSNLVHYLGDHKD